MDYDYSSDAFSDRYEEIDGQIVEMPPETELVRVIVSRLNVAMGYHTM